MASLVQIAPPADVMTLAEAKLHLRVEHSVEDALILALMRSAASQCQTHANRSIVTQQWRLTLDEFPPVIELERGPVQSVQSITYRDMAGAWQTLPAADYEVDLGDAIARVMPVYGKTWPTTQPQIGSVRVAYTAGYAAAPAEAIAWIKLQLGALYENREALAQGKVVTELPGGFADRLLDSIRVVRA